MTDWKPIESAPKDGTSILVYGRPEAPPNYGVSFTSPGAVTAYWDAVDGAFCLTGATWLGPFVKPTHWQPLPDPPREDASSKAQS